MQIGQYYFSKSQTITLSVLIIGLVVGLILVQREQNIKTRAAVSESYKIYENDENREPQLISYQGTYPSKTLNLIIESASFENQPTAPIQAKVTQPPKTSSLAQCQFMRAGDGAGRLKSIKSNRLIGYINEASQLTGIPPVVLAAFIRVEYGAAFDYNDNIAWENNCPVNQSSGATGVMQIMPPGKIGHDKGAVANGARLLGKSYDQLTYNDYCNARSNIIMGGGFILKKLSYSIPPAYPETYGDGSRWDPSWTNNQRVIEKMVYSYYGCIRYTSCVSGPYNYASDVLTSIQNCPTGH